MTSLPVISVVVPVYNGGWQLERCLDALRASEFQDFEIIVVDDASSDNSATICKARGDDVETLLSRSGPAAARNRGVEVARGNIVLFIDADVAVRPDTLSRVVSFFDEHRTVAAVFGSYDDEPHARNFVSQYKNLLHHFTHQQSSVRAETFWAGCGAVRRAAFISVGGFDEKQYTRPSVEDIELGYRLRRRGFLITLEKQLQVKHLKRWTITSLLRADVFQRAVPWSKLIMQNGELLDNLNLRISERICTALVALALLLLSLSYFVPTLLIGIPVALATVFVLNLRLFRFFKQRRGLSFSIASFPMLLFYYFYSGSVIALCSSAHLIRKAIGIESQAIQPLAKLGRGQDA